MFYFISSFPFLFALDVGGLGFEFCVFVAGWRHALRSEWPFTIITIMLTLENPDQCRQLSHGLCMCVCVIIGRICLFGLLDKPRTSAYVHACKQHRDS